MQLNMKLRIFWANFMLHTANSKLASSGTKAKFLMTVSTSSGKSRSEQDLQCVSVIADAAPDDLFQLLPGYSRSWTCAESRLLFDRCENLNHLNFIVLLNGISAMPSKHEV